MKKVLISLFAMIMLTLSVFVLTASAADDVITHSDGEGDVENDGFTGGPVDSVDITSVRVDQTNDPVIIELTVKGMIDYNNSDYLFDYQISLNQDENNDPEIDISINGIASSVITDDLGGIFSFPYSGQGTDTLHIELTKSQIGADAHPILDIEAYSSVARLSAPFGTIEDHVNDNFGGDDPGDDDTPTDDDDDPGDDGGWTGWDDDDDESIPDPKTETLTDGSVSVTIDKAEMSIKRGDETFEVEQDVEGTTTGTVHHCAWTMVTYFTDGTYEADDWTPGPEENPRTSLLGVTMEGYFYGTGSGGQTDWSDWALYNYVEAPNSWIDEFLGEVQNIEEDNVSSVVLYVRAYSDEEETLWNQDSFDMTEGLIEALESDGNGDKKTPAPGITAIMMAVSLILVGALIFRKRQRS